MPLANLLTYARIASIPFFVATFLFWPAAWGALILFAVASITDYLDGWVARKYNTVSDIGRFLDPIADKLLVVTALVVLVDAERASLLAVIIILLREIFIAGLREFLGGKNVTIHVSTLAKWKTACQMAAICLLLTPLAPMVMWWLGNTLLWIAALLGTYTGWEYTRKGWKHLQ